MTHPDRRSGKETAMLAIALALSLAAAPAENAAAPPPDAQALVRKVQAAYERTHDLTASFRQTYTYSGFGRRQVSSGQLQVKKPGMMRWEYQKPAPKTVAVKGNRLVQYEPGEAQAYVDEHFDSSGMSAALAFLLGRGDLEKEFEVSLSSAGALLLRPREPDPRVETIELVATPDGQISATRVVDGAGNVNEIQFEDVKRNTGIPDSAFEVKLPAGVQRLAPPGK
jgi:outer membrane lipoprotein carrier protein